MNFKEDVEFYLKNNKDFNYYGFDIANDSIAEDEDEDEGDEEASVKTKKLVQNVEKNRVNVMLLQLLVYMVKRMMMDGMHQLTPLHLISELHQKRLK